MQPIHVAEVSNEFAACWEAASHHLESQAGGEINSWLRGHLLPPFLDHLSFRLGNQLFFIRIEDVDGCLETPGTEQGLASLAENCAGHACLMPMIRRAGKWQVAESGWGLINAISKRPVQPVELITDEDIVMTDWELQDFAVQVVANQLRHEGHRILSMNTNPTVHPSLWFVDGDGAKWASVCAVRYPLREASAPKCLAQLRSRFLSEGFEGYFASVSVASANDPFDPLAHQNGNVLPLYRGHEMLVRFEGLQEIEVVLEKQ